MLQVNEIHSVYHNLQAKKEVKFSVYILFQCRHDGLGDIGFLPKQHS